MGGKMRRWLRVGKTEGYGWEKGRVIDRKIGGGLRVGNEGIVKGREKGGGLWVGKWAGLMVGKRGRIMGEEGGG